MSTYRVQKGERRNPLIITLAQNPAEQAGATALIKIKHQGTGVVKVLTGAVSSTPQGTIPETYKITLQYDWVADNWDSTKTDYIAPGRYSMWSYPTFQSKVSVVPYFQEDVLVVGDAP